MPGVQCSVPVCTNNFYSAKKKNLNLSFFKFPRDVNLRKIWIKRCRRKDRFNPETAYICSAHFQETDFERDLQSELLNLPSRRRNLKKTAVPCRKLKYNEIDEENDDHSEIEKELENKKLVEDLLNNSTSTPNLSFDTIEILIPKEEEPSLETKYQHLQVKYEKLKIKLAEVRDRNRCLQNQVTNLEKESLCTFQNLEVERRARIKLENVLNKIFTKTQIAILQETKQKVRWTNEDILTAFALRYLSKRCYLFLRSKMNFPFPHISTLQKWACRLKIEEGILDDVFTIMNIVGKTLTDLEKVTVLQLTQMKVRSAYEYDKINDQIKGPHKYMQVIMARGLFKQWKQPLYIDFDKKMTNDILNKIILDLHNIEYQVVACVSDFCGNNADLWYKLDISIESTYFTHPMSNKNIYVFADAPNLIKEMRNWLFDTGFILEDGSVINKTPVKALIDITDKQIRVLHKLTAKHIDCLHTEWQNVNLAKRLISQNTATAICHCLPGPDEELAYKTGKFIELTSKWFDILNSHSLKESIFRKKPYGFDLEAQNAILNEMEDVMKNMLCIGRTTLQTFQKGFLISSNSLKGLYSDLAAEHEVSYIQTNRLNLDCIEKMFGDVKTSEAFYPTPLETLQRFRQLILGKIPAERKFNTEETSSDDDISEDDFLVANVVKRAQINVKVELASLNYDLKGDASSELLTDGDDIRESEENAFRSLCCWIARKFGQEHLNLVSFKEDLPPQSDHEYSESDHYLEHLSFEDSVAPSEEWLEKAQYFEDIFINYHKDTVCKEEHIIQKIVSEIHSKYLDFPQEVIEAFVLQRTYIRLRHLNSQKNMSLTEKRQAICDDNVVKKRKN